MPPKHVYGKRSKAIYDPLAVFGSPQSAGRPAKQDAITELADEVRKLEINEPQQAAQKPVKKSRRALEERNANSQVECEVKKTQRKGRRRKVGEAGDKIQETDVVRELDQAVAQTSFKKKDSIFVEKGSRSLQDDGPVKLPLTASTGHKPVEDDDKENDDPVEDGAKAPAKVNTSASEIQEEKQGAIEPENHDPDHFVPPPLPVKNIYTQYCQPLLALSSHPMTDFASWSEQLASHFSLTKIAEASFGEVYRISLLQHIPGLSRADESVFKVIALKPPPATLPRDAKKRNAALKKAEAMSKVEDVANEVKLLQRMSSIPGFTNFRDVRILQGRPPRLFAEAFKSWNESQRAKKKDGSVFPDPTKKSSYDADQLWAVIEMQDAGMDLERYIEAGSARDIWTVWDVFWQVILSLAKGEEGAEFEHRDLHLGNICVRSISPSSSQDEPGRSIDVKKKLGFEELETTIIDYTISRCTMPSHEIAFTDLAHESQSSLFEGDSTNEYQYDIYRYMRGAALLSDPMADFSLPATRAASAQAIAEGRNWRAFHPVTNLVWLHFILYKLLEQVRWPSAQKAPARKTKAKEHAQWKRANDLEHKLLKVQNLLDPETVCSEDCSMRSASDLVSLAVAEGWLDVSDVVGEACLVDSPALTGDGFDAAEPEVQCSADAETGYSSELREKMAGLKVRVDLIEECGLEIAEEEARANTRNVRKGRKGRKR